MKRLVTGQEILERSGQKSGNFILIQEKSTVWRKVIENYSCNTNDLMPLKAEKLNISGDCDLNEVFPKRRRRIVFKELAVVN